MIHLYDCICLYFQGVIQDVKLIFAPNGYITQCPNLNRSKYLNSIVKNKEGCEKWSFVCVVFTTILQTGITCFFFSPAVWFFIWLLVFFLPLFLNLFPVKQIKIQGHCFVTLCLWSIRQSDAGASILIHPPLA